MNVRSRLLTQAFAVTYVAIWATTRYLYATDPLQFFFGMYRRPVLIENTVLSAFLYSGFPLFLGSIMVLLISSRLARAPNVIGILLLVISAMVLVFFEGVRGRLLQLTTVVLLSEAIVSYRLGKRPISWIGIIVAVLSASLIIVLSGVRGELIFSLSDLVDAVKYNVFSGSGNLNSSLQASYSINDAVAFIVDYYKWHEFDYFHTFFAISTNWIPRDMWSGKPVGYGLLLADYYGFPRGSGVSLAAGIAGEGYANGGLLGLLFLTASIGGLTGFCGGVAFHGFARRVSPVAIFLSSLFFSVSIFFVRGDMLSAWGSSVYSLVGALIVLRTAKTILTKPARVRGRNI